MKKNKIKLDANEEIEMLGKRGFQTVRYIERENINVWRFSDDEGQTIFKMYGTSETVKRNLKFLYLKINEMV